MRTTSQLVIYLSSSLIPTVKVRCTLSPFFKTVQIGGSAGNFHSTNVLYLFVMYCEGMDNNCGLKTSRLHLRTKHQLSSSLKNAVSFTVYIFLSSINAVNRNQLCRRPCLP